MTGVAFTFEGSVLRKATPPRWTPDHPPVARMKRLGAPRVVTQEAMARWRLLGTEERLAAWEWIEFMSDEELADSVRVQRRLFSNPGLADSIIRAAASDARLCRLLARVALGEEALRRRKLEMAWRFFRAALRRRIGRYLSLIAA